MNEVGSRPIKMRCTVYWVEADGARLGIMPHPRGGDWLEDDLESLREQKVVAVVSLLTREEEEELDLSKEAELCGAHGLEYISFPIDDRGVPTSKSEAMAVIGSITKRVSKGQSVVIHCRMGIGRSALVAACVLVLNGLDADAAFERVSSARGCSVPDTKEQVRWVGAFQRLTNEIANEVAT